MDLKQLTKTKDAGNQLFKNKDYRGAIQKFTQTITLIEAQQTRDYLLKDTDVSKLYVICLINTALACISLKDQQNYDRAVECCNKALAIQSGNLKGLYRRALARREKAEMLERAHGVRHPGLLELYEKSKQDFEKLCLLDKTNELATKNLGLTVKDIYRVTVGRGEQVDFRSQPSSTGQQAQPVAKTKPNPYQPQPKPKKQSDMTRIMQEYKVQQVTSTVQQKVRAQYLTAPLPTLLSQFQKALRTLQKSQQTFLLFTYRLTYEYLDKLQPSFDTLGQIVEVVVRRGEGEPARGVLEAVQRVKGFRLLWKSYLPTEREALRGKWVGLGLAEDRLQG